ncbi:MAG: hypothetical protein HXY43_01030 [Fischerella sp.]|nr:hypothetical protein [Fischerella sp.]NWF57926.1 hypothetical protein [Fischerella sp.]
MSVSLIQVGGALVNIALQWCDRRHHPMRSRHYKRKQINAVDRAISNY